MPSRVAAALLTILGLVSAAAPVRVSRAPELEAEMRAAGFTDVQIAAVQAGGLMTRLRLQKEDNAAFVIGVTRIAAPQARLVEDMRNVGRSGWTPAGHRTLQAGRFGTPPTLEDLQPLRLEHQDLRDLSRCHVGDCDVQVGRRTMEEAREIDWRFTASETQAAQLVKTMLLERVTAYLRDGTPATYDDGPTPEHVAIGFEYILQHSPALCSRDQPLYAYLLQFPNGPDLPRTEQLVYWTKVRVVKPVVSIVHAVIQDEDSASPGRREIALKHVYDSHYFLAYAEFLTLLPEPGTNDAFYLVRSVRALINPPHGLLRGVLLGRIKNGMRDQLAEDLAHTKQRLECSAAGREDAQAHLSGSFPPHQPWCPPKARARTRAGPACGRSPSPGRYR